MQAPPLSPAAHASSNISPRSIASFAHQDKERAEDGRSAPAPWTACAHLQPLATVEMMRVLTPESGTPVPLPPKALGLLSTQLVGLGLVVMVVLARICQAGRQAPVSSQSVRHLAGLVAARSGSREPKAQ